MLTFIVSLWLAPPAGCTTDNPLPSVSNSICIGFGLNGTSCKVNAVSCSPIPGQPGTWNPNGYTPKVG